jgi:hypothetical protein
VSGSPLSRRAVLRSGGVVGVLGAAVVSGCDLDPTSLPAAPAPAPTDPDQTIVDSARAELTTLIGRLRATSVVVGQAAAARSGPASLVAVHRTQLGALGGDPPPAGPRGRAFSPTELVAHERRAAARFAHWSLTCNNGDLARVLASVATGIRMQPVLTKAAT